MLIAEMKGVLLIEWATDPAWKNNLPRRTEKWYGCANRGQHALIFFPGVSLKDTLKYLELIILLVYLVPTGNIGPSHPPIIQSITVIHWGQVSGKSS